MSKLEEILRKIGKKEEILYSYSAPQGMDKSLAEYKEKIIFNNKIIKIPCQREYFSYSDEGEDVLDRAALGRSVYGDKSEHISSILSKCSECFFFGGMKAKGEFTTPDCAAKQLELIWPKLSPKERENTIMFLMCVYDLKIEKEE